MKVPRKPKTIAPKLQPAHMHITLPVDLYEMLKLRALYDRRPAVAILREALKMFLDRRAHAARGKASRAGR